ncbi:MAG: transposase [Bacteroidota bacterium]
MRDLKNLTSKKILSEVHSNAQESRREWLEMIFKYHAKCNKRVEKQQLWTHENHAVELSSNEMIDSRVDYIHENPVRAGWVEAPEEYVYSSARNFSKRIYSIEIDEL